MVKTKKAGKSGPMTVTERERLLAQIDSEKSYRRQLGKDLPENGSLGAMDAAGTKAVSTAKLDAKIKRMEGVLEGGTPDGKLKAAEIRAMEAEAKALAAWIADHALTRKEIDLMPRHGYEYHAAVRKSSKSEVGNPEFAKKCGRYREIQAQIAPEDPEATSIDKLRKPY